MQSLSNSGDYFSMFQLNAISFIVHVYISTVFPFLSETRYAFVLNFHFDLPVSQFIKYNL